MLGLATLTAALACFAGTATKANAYPVIEMGNNDGGFCYGVEFGDYGRSPNGHLWRCEFVGYGPTLYYWILIA